MPAELPGFGAPSGIRKKQVEGRIKLGPRGLAGDGVADREHHGRPEQAVYALGALDRDYWQEQLQRELPPGSMGENLVIADMDTHDVLVGDRFVLPDAVLEAVWPRIPCTKLAHVMGDKKFGRGFLRSGHLGVYFRVIQPGSLAAGDAAALDASAAVDRRILDVVA
ncbi:MAG: MOSC domain-containing protein [Betaproteobacteria bacterium AqS2]|uniref:MOSC domain-containing protein n=1 Tax=Candidatus Amphirhobacter heronislandensis TaxID=1732024 RepID=A0A930UDV5_9GAMM|nr:MOSC domain-containing protein [Betaproteobacteria bacterium AqS2]